MIPVLIFTITLLGLSPAARAAAVTSVDFLESRGVTVNAAGPLLVQMDESRNRLIVANTLTSSMSIVDCKDHSVMNIPLGGRALQHLKAESMTFDRQTGDVYLIGTNCVYIVSVDGKSTLTVATDVQFESIAVDEKTGNVFVAGRESKGLGFIKTGSSKLKPKKWLDTSEDLINLNATPPPPIRKVVADNSLGRVVAVDGIDPALYTFDATTARHRSTRPLTLEAGGRWHLAGYNEDRHSLYLVVERTDRKVVQAARIDVPEGDHVVVPLPEYTEGVGIVYNAAREEVYVAYDNHPSVHVVGFDDGGSVEEIRLPAYGNDAAAVDPDNDMLYIGSWAQGEIDVVDLETRTLTKRITNLGIIPHMFTIAFNPNTGLIYYPKGASAVNGTFGAAVTALDPASEATKKIYTGWAPIDLVAPPDRDGFLVFNSEDQVADVRPDGSYDLHDLPYDYPVRAVRGPSNHVFLSYGPHQSYWPTVYIWGAKNGILGIDDDDFMSYDRRIPRQAHCLVFDKNGVLYFTQNNWGKEEQFVGVLPDPVRLYDSNRRLRLEDEVQRETTQRILEYDPSSNVLYLVRVGENDDDPSVLQVIDPVEKTVVQRLELGLTASDLVFDDDRIYVANFDSKSVSVIEKSEFRVRGVETGDKPLRLVRCGGKVLAINHVANTLQEIEDKGRTYKLPRKGFPDNIFEWRDKAVITSHAADKLYVIQYDPESKKFETLHEMEYPYGDTRYDSRNVSFYVRGQFGDGVFDITRAEVDSDLRLWVTDFLSGKLIIIE
jgi:DNA-binding beta-propeller fold protein YncE